MGFRVKEANAWKSTVYEGDAANVSELLVIEHGSKAGASCGGARGEAGSPIRKEEVPKRRKAVLPNGERKPNYCHS